MTNKKLPLFTICENPEYLPFYASEQAAGADLKAAIHEPLVLKAGGYVLVSTGLRVEIPEGFEIQLRPRSGLALKHGISVLNSPGTIDGDYRGIIGVILVNHSQVDFTITPGMRIAQMVVAPFVQAEFIQKETLTATARGDGGFGHTGTIS